MEIIARLDNLPGALPGACAQGLIWGIMAIGVYITFRILDVADLTVDVTMATGGAAFIIPYIFFTFTIGTMLVMAEIALVRRGRGSVMSAMMRVGGRWCAPLGIFAVLTSFLILSYYSVVGGWCVAYLFDALTGAVTISDPEVL